MKRTLEELVETGPTQDATRTALIRLVRSIRPRRATQPESATSQLHNLIALLRTHEEGRRTLRDGLLDIVGCGRLLALASESGIQSNAGFFTEAVEKVAHRFLPPLADPKDLKDLVSLVFERKDDHVWVASIAPALWMELFEVLLGDAPAEKMRPILDHTLEALRILALRLTAVGLEPDVVRRMPSLEHVGSPILEQQERVRALVQAVEAGTDTVPAQAALLSALEGCDEAVSDLRQRRGELGASLHLTWLLRRLSQLAARLRLLTRLVADAAPGERRGALVQLLVEVVRSENLKNSLREHLDGNIELLAFQITEHTGRTGDHYITSNRSEWRSMFLSAAGGGFIVSFLVVIKLIMYLLGLAPFVQAFAYSMTYGLGFISIHLAHGTLATKQPAMIASKLAAALDRRGGGVSLEDLAGMIVRVARSQFVAFLGNILIAFPVTFLIALLIKYLRGGVPIASPEKAQAFIEELHPLESLAVPHAAIAGIWLFVSGLLSGYFDNLVVTNSIAARLKEHPLLKRLMSESRRERFANYIHGNLGSLAGNFFLGIFLGTTGMLGFMLGLPLDIRHITFSTGNFGLAVATLGLTIPWQTVLWTLGGIVAIGATNFSVSFGLSLLVAIRSRGVSFAETPTLLGLLWKRFRSGPREFFIPPPDPVLVPAVEGLTQEKAPPSQT